MDKKAIGIIGALVLVIVGVGAFLLLTGNKSEQVEDDTIQEKVIPSISPEELGLEMQLRGDNQAVMFSLSKVADIKELEYEIVWDANSPEDPNIKLNRSAVGSDTVSEGATSYESEFIDLGTCSSGRCRFDTGVTKVQLVLKITKKDGKVYQSEKSVSVEE